MGIENLLAMVKPYAEKKHLSDFKTKRIAIDGYCWLHKAIYCDEMDLAFNPNSMSFVYFIKAKLEKMLKHQIIPIMIFDGNKLPIKNSEESCRAYKREIKQAQAHKLLEEGKTLEAKIKMISSIDITPKMVGKLIKILKELKIEFIVAPFEADAQLAYLSKTGYADIICTEDSDLIAYGCEQIIYKLDNQGYCLEVNLNIVLNKLSMKDHDQLLQGCVLAGCDFFKLTGISAKRAFKLISSKGSFLKSLGEIERITKTKVSSEVQNQFLQAYLTFKHQYIYCPFEKKIKHLTEPDLEINHSKLADFLGKPLDSDLAYEVACGNIDPFTLSSLEL